MFNMHAINWWAVFATFGLILLCYIADYLRQIHWELVCIKDEIIDRFPTNQELLERMEEEPVNY